MAILYSAFYKKYKSCITTGIIFLSRKNATKAELEQRQAQMMTRGLPKKKEITGVKQIILVASGKGGVGKSTTAVNLATALKYIEPKQEIGLLDADVFGPSIPLMMNLHETPLITDNDLMKPLINYGVKCMSMGFLVDEKSPVLWRGLMVMSAIERLLRQVAWSPLDVLVIDTPPGTGDTHLSLIQNLPLSGVVLVTTPQTAALEVARRGAVMFQKLNVPIIGIVQNMTSVECPNCKTSVNLFGNGISTMMKELGIEILQEIPLHPSISHSTDAGKPIVIDLPKSSQSAAYRNLAEKVLKFLQQDLDHRK